MTLSNDQTFNSSNLTRKAQQFLSLQDDVIDHWERAVRVAVEGADAIPSPVLTDTLPAFYTNIAEALSPEHPREDATSDNNAAAAHGEERARMTRLRVDQIAQEYQIFRDSIRAVAAGRIDLDSMDWAVIDQSLNRATVEAIRAFMAVTEELRSRAAATLTHDMRTPLAVISSAAELIGLTSDISTAHKVAVKISSNVRRIDAMTTELINALVYRKQSGAALRLTQFDMLSLVSETREQYFTHRRSDVKIVAVGKSVVGFWCRDSMHRALENLINNALKYGDGGQIRIKVCESRGRLMLSVHNWGDPIPKSRQDRIFDYLKREGNAVADSGWGIGLPFVKSTAESHGGTVAVDSSALTGTAFLIDIPVDCRLYAEMPFSR